MITGSGLRFSSLGQNQAMSAMALGIAPKTIAQGEKIEETNRIPTATEAMNGYGVRSRLNRCPPDEERARAFEEIAARS